MKESKMNDTLVFNTEDNSLQKQTRIFSLVPEDHPILREALLEFDFDNPPVNPTEFASNLIDTCIANKGYGLSANQCGFKHRVFVMGTGSEYVAFFNPRIVESSTEKVHMSEMCLSFPMLELKISRPAGIVVEYQDYNGEVRKANFVGLSARCFLHELDHMNGIVYTDNVKPLAYKMGLKKRQKVKNLVKKLKKADDVYKKLGNNLERDNVNTN
jgi:peptide deformylase